MKRTICLVLLASFLSGCGLLYTNVRVPRAYRAPTPSDVTSASTDPVVTGEGCNQSLLYLFAWGDAGYAAAVKDAMKAHPDGFLYDVKADIRARAYVIGLYTKTCTIVTGRVGKK